MEVGNRPIAARHASTEMNKVLAKVIGPMPPFYRIADALWGEGADIDSDGDSDTPESTDWRELTLILRPSDELRIDIDPVREDRDLVEITSESPELLSQTLAYLEECGSVARIDTDSSV